MSKFYLITLDTCGHCHTFLNNVWPEILPEIMRLGYEIQHHDVTYSKQRQWNINHPYLSARISWYPTLLIINDTKDVYRYEGDMDDVQAILDWIYRTTI